MKTLNQLNIIRRVQIGIIIDAYRMEGDFRFTIKHLTYSSVITNINLNRLPPF